MKKKIENSTIINCKRIGIDVSEEFLVEVKSRAAFKHQSIRKWVLEAIALKMAQEDRFK